MLLWRWICPLVMAAISSQMTHVNGGHVFCYYSSFAQTRRGVGRFLPEKIDPFLCSHVIYAFVDITADGTGLKPFNRNDQGSNGLYARTLALKKRNPELKVLLAVGGWQIGSKPFIPMISSERTRNVWVKNVIKYLRRHAFDGFDVDWEFPATRGSPPEDKYRFTELMKELYEAFRLEAQQSGRDKLLLTMATASGTFYIDQSYEPRKIINSIDFMLLMTYNYHGQWEGSTGHHSGLYAHPDDPRTGETSELHQQWSIDYWLNVGIPPEKLVVGIPTYGMTFTLADPSQHGIHAPAVGGGRIGDFTRETGILAYYEICLSQRDEGWTREWLDDQAVPYTFHNDQWAGYDDIKSVTLKSENIVSRGLAGAFVWSVEMDDFNGVCDQGTYPLLRAINQIINSHDQMRPHSTLSDDLEPTVTSGSPNDPATQMNGNNNKIIRINRVTKMKKLRRRRKQKARSGIERPPKTTVAKPVRRHMTSTVSPTSGSVQTTMTSLPATTRQTLKVKWWSGTVYKKQGLNKSTKRRRVGVAATKKKGIMQEYKGTKLWGKKHAAISRAAASRIVKAHEYFDDTDDDGDDDIDDDGDDDGGDDVDAVDCQKLGVGTFPDPQSCSRYVICLSGSWLDHPAHVMQCPRGTMYDQDLSICNYASRVHCPWGQDSP